MAEELWKASAVELAAGIRDKRFSCGEVMTSVVARIRALNPSLHAIVVDRSEQALASLPPSASVRSTTATTLAARSAFRPS